MAGLEEAEDFLDRVNEVTRLIDGLKDGTLPPEYVDKREAEIRTRESDAEAAETKRKEEEESRRFENLPPERQAELMAKVEAIKQNRDRKERLRRAYDAHVAATEGEGVARSAGTDYAKWDLYTPSDEEDAMLSEMTPDTPEFRAMEKDIDERHRKMTERRQLAERKRVLGNDSFRSGQFSEALQLYEEGIDAEKSNMALHANAAAAALKLACHVQCIAHCDKVFSIAEFVHDDKPHTLPSKLKALQRRAQARLNLGHHKQAVEDLRAAQAIAGAGDAEVRRQLAAAEAAHDEAKRGREMKRAVDAGADGAMQERLRKVAQASHDFVHAAEEEEEGEGEGEGGGQDPGSKRKGQLRRRSEAACEVLASAMAEGAEDAADVRVFARESGALGRLLALYANRRNARQPHRPARAAPMLAAIAAACAGGQARNAAHACEESCGVVRRCVSDLALPIAEDRTAALHLLALLCAVEDAPACRKAVAAALLPPSTDRPTAAGPSSGLSRVVSLLYPDANRPGVCALAAQVLSRACVEAAFRRHVGSNHAGMFTAAMEGAAAVLGSSAHTQAHDAAASLVANLALDAMARKRFAEHPPKREGGVGGIGGGGGGGEGTHVGWLVRSIASRGAAVAGSGPLWNALANVLVESRVLSIACSEGVGGVAAIIAGLEGCAALPTEGGRLERAAIMMTCAARLAATPEGVAGLMARESVGGVLAWAAAALKPTAPSAPAAKALGAALRVLCRVAVAAGERAPALLLPMGAYAVVRDVLLTAEGKGKGKGKGEGEGEGEGERDAGGMAGNAALLVSELARTDAGLDRLGSLGAVNLIPSLTSLAHAASSHESRKNAAIAVARLVRLPEGVTTLKKHPGAMEILAMAAAGR